jgi:CRP-like cAMP-binding protein
VRLPSVVRTDLTRPRRTHRSLTKRRILANVRFGRQAPTKPCRVTLLGKSSMTSLTITKTANHLLSALKPSDFSQVARNLTRVRLRPKQVIYKPHAPLDYIYFPEDTVLCLLTIMSNGDSIESATVGREGASWISASVGARSMPCETMAVHDGKALKVAVEDLDRELRENKPFRDVLTEYSHALLIASMRTSACNGLHRLQQRCARWLLTTLDRVEGDQFFITKEFLAQLLGTSRPMVSVTVAVFEKAGILKVDGRRITVADRKRLKEASCECYDVIRRHYLKVGK